MDFRVCPCFAIRIVVDGAKLVFRFFLDPFREVHLGIGAGPIFLLEDQEVGRITLLNGARVNNCQVLYMTHSSS